jgi:hypothetical protein
MSGLDDRQRESYRRRLNANGARVADTTGHTDTEAKLHVG